EKIKIPAAEIEAVKTMKDFRNPIYISFDEWGTFGRNFLSVLPIAQCLNSFIRHADVVKMTNFTLATSLLGSDREKGTYKTPLFYVFKSFSNNCLGSSVDTYVECDTFNTEKYKGIPYLDVTTVYSRETNLQTGQAGTVFINVVNRHKDNAIVTEIVNNSGEFNGKALVNEVNSDSLNEPFTFDKQEEYIPASKEIEIEGNKISYSFPPHSFTQIKVGVNNSQDKE
ncbi:MAG TPA: alpha-L-arabinofuranosidase C-terminal domain-containing protein, partial [Ignavibacteria bacterium]|nr:alpha-L-arabinofuranosidase C-terminal domain-containing protein [Ignavibacteria bacterium]